MFTCKAVYTLDDSGGFSSRYYLSARFHVLRGAVAPYIKHYIEKVIVPLSSSFVEFICVANKFILCDDFILILG